MPAISEPCGKNNATEVVPSRIKGLFVSLLYEFQIRRARRQVEALDDAALYDMGISRGSIEDAVRCGRR